MRSVFACLLLTLLATSISSFGVGTTTSSSSIQRHAAESPMLPGAPPTTFCDNNNNQMRDYKRPLQPTVGVYTESAMHINYLFIVYQLYNYCGSLPFGVLGF